MFRRIYHQRRICSECYGITSISVSLCQVRLALHYKFIAVYSVLTGEIIGGLTVTWYLPGELGYVSGRIYSSIDEYTLTFYNVALYTLRYVGTYVSTYVLLSVHVYAH